MKAAIQLLLIRLFQQATICSAGTARAAVSLELS
jgi:hypothetical protein